MEPGPPNAGGRAPSREFIYFFFAPFSKFRRSLAPRNLRPRRKVFSFFPTQDPGPENEPGGLARE